MKGSRFMTTRTILSSAHYPTCPYGDSTPMSACINNAAELYQQLPGRTRLKRTYDRRKRACVTLARIGLVLDVYVIDIFEID